MSRFTNGRVGRLVLLLIAGLPIAFVLGVTAATMILLDPAVVPQIIDNYRRSRSGQPLLNVVDPKRGY